MITDFRASNLKKICIYIIISNGTFLYNVHLILGQMFSPDQVCELKYGTGYRFRKYPKLGVRKTMLQIMSDI